MDCGMNNPADHTWAGRTSALFLFYVSIWQVQNWDRPISPRLKLILYPLDDSLFCCTVWKLSIIAVDNKYFLLPPHCLALVRSAVLPDFNCWVKACTKPQVILKCQHAKPVQNSWIADTDMLHIHPSPS